MPVKCIADSSQTFKGPDLARFLTTQRFRKTARKAFTAPDFDNVHRSIAERQYSYIGWPRQNSVRVRTGWFGALAAGYIIGFINFRRCG